MSTIQLPGGTKVTSFPEPPEGFDPLTADEKTLLHYGYPRRPVEHASFLPHWERAVSHPGSRSRSVSATSQPIPKPNAVRKPVPQTSPINTSIFAGVEVEAPRGEGITVAFGTFIVPNLFTGAYETLAGSDSSELLSYCQPYVAIESIGALESFRAGVLCFLETDTAGQTVVQNYQSFWEWLPFEGSFNDFGVPVNEGDEVQILICTSETGKSGLVFFINFTQNQSNVQAVLPSGSNGVGAIARWGVERFAFGESIRNIPNFQTLSFSGSFAGNSTTTVDPIDGLAFDMTDYGNPPQIVVTGSAPTSGDVICQYKL